MTDANPFAAAFQFPENMRAFAETTVAQAKDGYARLKHTAESSNDAIEAVRQTAANGVSEYVTKMLDVTKANTEAAFDLAHDLAGATSPAAVATMWTSFAQKQFETITAQSRDLAALSQTIAVKTAEPITSAAADILKTERSA